MSRATIDAHAAHAQVFPRRPGRIFDLELAGEIGDLSWRDECGHQYESAWILARRHGRPVGLFALPFADQDLTEAEIRAAAAAECADAVRDHPSAAEKGRSLAARHLELATDGPALTVVLCTRDRPDDVVRAIDSLRGQTYPNFRVLVVDNSPTDDRTRAAVARAAFDPDRLTYSVEARPGLSWARNHALSVLRTPFVAWLDDDEVADPNWLWELAEAFHSHPDLAAVSGLVVPAELNTLPQLWFEQFGGHSKGRGFVADLFGGPSDDRQSPLYPLPAFGVGANMAFRTSSLAAIGGFDTALGAGTATLGGEDTLAFSRLLLRGERIAYRPSAVTRHFHRTDYASLAKQMRGYGCGLTAYYAALLRLDWKLIGPLARLAPRALRDMFGKNGLAVAGLPDTFPRELLRLKTKGMLTGPFAYASARRRARKIGRGQW